MRKKLPTLRTRAKKWVQNVQTVRQQAAMVGRFSLVRQNWVAPLGASRYPNGQALSALDLVSAARSKRTVSDRFEHLNGSAR
jgi:superfamily I DNA and RNA helicase